MIRHFLRIGAGIAVGRRNTMMTFVRTDDTLHLDTEREGEAAMADDLAGAPGWVELGSDGKPVASDDEVTELADDVEEVTDDDAARDERAGIATPTVGVFGDPETTQIATE